MSWNDDNNETTTSKYFEYKTITANINELNTEVVVPLKYLSNFQKSLDLPLNDCKIEFHLHGQKIV